MKNDNDLILEQLRGVPMQEADWKDKFDPRNPNLPNANDNKPKKRPFYGAECRSYPNCNGGCGLGCTKEIEGANSDQQLIDD